MMKVALLLAQGTSSLLKQSIQVVTHVLQELEVEVELVELHRLPYFEGKETKQMRHIVGAIQESKGIIALTNVPMLGMHGAMQSFFDHASLYNEVSLGKPLFAIAESEWLGAREATQMIHRGWEILGGVEAGSVCLNSMTSEEVLLERVEKEIEGFYRFIKQERRVIVSSERTLYCQMKSTKQGAQVAERKSNESNGEVPEIRSFAELVKRQSVIPHVDNQGIEVQEVNRPKEVNQPAIDVSTKEQTIKEIAKLIEKETYGDEFKSLHTGTYSRPTQIITSHNGIKRLHQIPHYFIAQHDQALEMVLKYHVTDLKEEGYIVISQGDCNFVEQTHEMPTVEMSLIEEVLLQILSKKLTYQKAFMLGKLKVKGNFSILPKLDQIFKAL